MEKQYCLEHLGCANCAAKIEAKLNKRSDIKTAVIDFAHKKLILDYIGNLEEEELITEITAVVTGIEAGTAVIPWADYKAQGQLHKSPSHSHHHEDAHTCGQNSHHCKHSHHDHEQPDSFQPSGNAHTHQQKKNQSLAHSHTHGDNNNTSSSLQIIMLIVGTAVGFASIAFLPEGILQFLGVLAGYLLIGYQVLITAVRNIFHGEIFDENFLMSIATIGAFAIGEYPEALAVMILYQIGEYLQDKAVDKSRRQITDAMNIKAESANLKTPDGIISVSPEDVNIGDFILVRPSERIPLDGVVAEGSSFIDTSSLTGESVPRKVSPEDEILSGCINGSSTLTVKVTKPYTESTVAKVLDLVENATARKSPTENFITKFARIYTPVVVIAALLLALLPPIINGTFDFIPWIYKACGFLVVSCPCALVISVPLGFFGGIGAASKNGIVIKGSNYLEALNHVTYAVFDKTGTLTKGTFHITQITPSAAITGTKEEKEHTMLSFAAAAESFSTHPIARSVITAFGQSIDTADVTGYEEVAGRGVKAVYKNQTILLGNSKLMDTFQIAYEKTSATQGTVSYLAVDGIFYGSIVIADEIKTDSKKAISQLKSRGIKTIMLTGDTRATADAVADEIGLDAAYSQLLPGDKVNKLEEIIKQANPKEKVLFAGDGINDAPVLARADIGVAMGGLGSDAAVEAADIVLMTDEPSLLGKAIAIARYTRKIVTENIIFSLGIKLLVMLLLSIGLGNLWIAIFADVGVALIAVVNSLRVLRIK